MKNSIDSYPETHQFGRISIENLPESELPGDREALTKNSRF